MTSFQRGTQNAERRADVAGRRLAGAAWVLGIVALCATAVGCGLIASPIVHISERFSGRKQVDTAEMGGGPVDAALLVGADWNLVPPDPQLLLDPALPRRRHATLEPLFALPPAERPNLVPALDLPEVVLRTNAAIGLARWGDGRGLDVLVATVDDQALNLALREAAAEALGGIKNPSPVPALRRLLDAWGRYEPSRPLNYSPELHAHLLRALSRHVDASADAHFIEALRSPTAGPRHEALAAFARSTEGELPPAIVDLRGDPDAQIRAAAVVLTIDRRHPQALDFAATALKDYETDVRVATVAALGRHGGPEARAMLERIMLHEGEVLRAEAVSALDELGAWDAVQAAATDRAWRVRRSVARALANHPDRAGASLARLFMADDSGEVRKAAVAAIDGWPLPAAGPVLLDALTEPTFETRRQAGELLARRWPPAASFHNDLPPARRTEVVDELHRLWAAEFGAIDREALAAATSPGAGAAASTDGATGAYVPLPPRAATLTPARLDQLQKMLDDAAGEPEAPVSLDVFGPDLIEALERLLVDRGAVLPEFVYVQVLPSKGAEFAALEQMVAAVDVQERRRAADRLAEAARVSALRPLAVARLVDLGTREQDGLVWRSLFTAVAGDAGDTAARLAYAGLSHASPEVRRMSCEHLGRAPQPKHAPALLAALSDPHVSVATEAVRALGHPGMLAEAGPVEPLVASGDNHLRFAAALTLHRNRLPQGTAALERLAHDHDPEIRRRAAAVMGTTGDAVFIPTLVELLGDSLGVQAATVDALTKIVGTDISVKPDEPPPSLADRAAAWRAWYSRKP